MHMAEKCQSYAKLKSLCVYTTCVLGSFEKGLMILPQSPKHFWVCISMPSFCLFLIHVCKYPEIWIPLRHSSWLRSGNTLTILGIYL